MTDARDDAIDRLIAHNEINAVLVRYCQGVDRRDWDRVIDCYHDDAIDYHNDFEGGPREFVEWIRPNHENVLSSMHVLSNVAIEISAEDPRLARVESYCLSRKTVASAGADLFFRDAGGDGPLRRTVACRYIDTFEYREGVGWRIAVRRVAIEWIRREPNEAFVAPHPGHAVSRRDRTDLLYSPLERA